MHMTLFRMLAMLRDGPLDAVSLLDRLGELAPSEAPSLPALYRHIRRATERGWLQIEVASEPDGGPGRPPQRYRLTPAGAEALRRRALELRTFTSLALEGDASGDG
jgi:DNA-binding PadR family transcriptional regulator